MSQDNQEDLASHGMFGVSGSGDTSGYGGLVRASHTFASSERPFGGYFVLVFSHNLMSPNNY